MTSATSSWEGEFKKNFELTLYFFTRSFIMVGMCWDTAGFVFKGLWLSATVLCRTYNVT